MSAPEQVSGVPRARPVEPGIPDPKARAHVDHGQEKNSKKQSASSKKRAASSSKKEEKPNHPPKGKNTNLGQEIDYKA